MHKLLIIDTETGGLNPQEYSILSLGAVVWEDCRILDTFEVFIAEPHPLIEDEAMSINKIDLLWLAQHGKAPENAVNDFHTFLKRHFELSERKDKIFIAGHNVGFDIGFLKRLYSFTQFNYSEVFSHRSLDTASIIKFLMIAGQLPLDDASSNAAFRFFNIYIEKGKRHTALADAIATAKLLNQAIDMVRNG